MRVAVVGATGMVGRVMLDVLEKSRFPVTELIPVASQQSAGKSIDWSGNTWRICSMEEAVAKRPSLALFSAGGSVSLEWAPRFAAVGTTVIDNSSAWRMDSDKKLVIPEINAHLLSPTDKIIANPNCSTIQLLMVLKPLQDSFGLERVIISTYQSVTGTGQKAVAQMEAERQGEVPDMVYTYPIDQNCIPHCDVFLDNGYTKEEMKLVNESRKILGVPDLRITATAVRVPVVGGHSESVNIALSKPATVAAIQSLLDASPGVVLQDDPSKNIYPMPRLARHRDEVFVGRIRQDASAENCFNLWIVADNLRKGAATNAVQIAMYLLSNSLLK
jgi:aspartate-semialdehyde dehydrogenase